MRIRSPGESDATLREHDTPAVIAPIRGSRCGNPGRVADDQHRVDCVTSVEILSAALDGEDSTERHRAAQRHLEDCAGCRAWYRKATALTRAVRVMPAEPGPDVTEAVLPALRPRLRDRLRGPAGRRVRFGLRVLLGAVALVQLAIAVSQLTGAGVRVDPSLIRQTLPHVDHETGAWNAAIAVALAWVAFRVRHAAAHLPVLASFVGVLMGLCLFDLLTGHVGIARVISHAPILLGLLLVAGLAALGSSHRDPGSPVSWAEWLPPAETPLPEEREVHDHAAEVPGNGYRLRAGPADATPGSTTSPVADRESA